MASTAAFTLPQFTLYAGDDGAAFNLPLVTLSAQGSFTLNGAAFNLPRRGLTASGITGDVGIAEFNLPIVTLDIVAQQNGIGNAAFSLPMLQFAIVGETGVVGTAAFNLPVLTLEVIASQSVQADAAFRLPVLYLTAQGSTVLVSGFRTWALNLHKNALTEYDNFDFNSYAQFNGQTLACGAAGVVVLGTQNLDGAAEIDATVLTGLADFDFSGHKRVPRLYVDGAQQGDIHFKAITKEGGSRTYLLPWNHLSEQTQRRVPIGKGPRSRFWQFGISNVRGADFQTTSLMVYPIKLRRRIS